MDVHQAYNKWAIQYDTNENKTRDLEAKSLRSSLSKIPFTTCLEMGCGTGKNTEWLAEKARGITAVDLSEEMLAKAKEKIASDNVQFIQADINSEWHFATAPYDVVTFSLVLEHIEHLEPVLQKAANALKVGGHLYIGELHPFKQYTGSKARFETAEGTQVVSCFTHHISEFLDAGGKAGLGLLELEEYFDDDDRTGMPRILSLLFRKH